MPHSRKDGKPHEVSGKCVLPRPLPPAVLDQFLLKSPEYEKRRIREYVEWQATGEKVRRLEKVATERLHGRKLDAWDVQTDVTATG